jgi:[ribosomal protein S18]-alanine N-acetyltransferase
MRKAATEKPCLSVRRSRPADLEELSALESQVFSINRMSRRSLRWLLASPSAEVLVAEALAEFAGAAVVLFRANSRIARLYSLAVVPRLDGGGI